MTALRNGSRAAVGPGGAGGPRDTRAAATRWAVWESPFGPLTLVAGARGLRELRFPGRGGPLDEADRDPHALAAAIAQLEQYFAGERQRFELTLDLGGGTAFQRRVWALLQELPFGTTISYGALAERAGLAPEHVRVAAGAVARTPVPIVIPCHRVIAADGSLTGYLGGLQRKQALLDLERLAAQGLDPAPASWAFRQLALL